MLRSRWLVPLLFAWGAASACLDRPSYSYSDSVPVFGSTSFGGTISGGAGSGSTFGGMPAPPVCELERPVGAMTIFRTQALSNQLPVRPVLYLQATDDELKDLMDGGPLLVPPSPGTPASPLTAQLAQLALSLTGDRQTLVKELQQRFKVTRDTWPNPWALRLDEHAATEHMNPVLLRLKEGARLVLISNNLPTVVDVKNSPVDLTGTDGALAHPERIAAVFYLANDTTLGAGAMPCETGRRAFALGNEAMVESFEVGTDDIAERMQSDIDALTKLFDVARNCTKFDRGDGLSFHANTACTIWDFFDPTSSEYSAYQWSLGNPIELYKPTPQNLNSLIQALQADELPAEPFVSAPHPASNGDGGAGGASEGGASGGGAGGFGGI
ncbi:MAG TPA: hypothetical protein VHB79_17170 [Polyangiaceae bacterium]|nr:hypothetical protein [Polyangiaceae bacterium]